MMHPYASREYAAAFESLARPIYVEALGSTFLLREVPGSGRIDAMGVHPVCVLTLRDASAGLEALRAEGAVSLVFVTDVLTQPPESVLRNAFPRVRPFKRHHLVSEKLDREPCQDPTQRRGGTGHLLPHCRGLQPHAWPMW